jgi:selenocysteine lyase/cysteine desulfurase
MISRRGVLGGIGGVSAALPLGAAVGAGASPTLPDRRSFAVDGTDLNAAYTHALGRFATGAAQDYLHRRATDAAINWPVSNPRDEAVARYAALIGAAAAEIAVVPSTLEGECLIGDALGLGPGAGVVTDALHYDAALAWYGERARRGMPLTVIAPRRIGSGLAFDYDEFDRAITPGTRLVAISLVTSLTGYRHDLKRLCAIAHAKGALVYADIIQAVGAIPFDVRNSGVDFACAGAYKWLMGDFGVAFLYVKAAALPRLHRVQLGWRGISRYRSHVLPGDAPGSPAGDWALADTTAGLFEVSTPSWGGLAVASAALGYVQSHGVDAIARHRAPLLARLRTRLTAAGYAPLAPDDAHGPALVFGKPGLRQRYRDALLAAKVYTTVYPDRIRISPSIHNDMGDIDRVADILAKT